MEFKKWLFEIGGGIEPPLQKTTLYQGAFADFHGRDQTDPANPSGNLPPVAKNPDESYIGRRKRCPTKKPKR